MISKKQKVWVSIKGNLISDQIEEETSEFLTEGDLFWEDDSPCITYQESEVSGMGDTMTTVRVDGEKVSVIRLGDINSVMEFEKGKCKLNMYYTPYGEISMGIFTKDINIDCDRDARSLKNVRVDYNIEIKGLTNGSNVIEIEVKQ